MTTIYLLFLGGRSRSECQNLGGRKATGDILLFLHADTILPPNYGHLIRTALQSNSLYYYYYYYSYCLILDPDCVIGSFSFDVDDHSVWGIDFIVELVRLRCKYFSLP